MDEVKKNSLYYQNHYDELVQKYDGKVLIIVNEAVAGVYNNVEDAYNSATEKYGLGHFSLHPCSSRSRGIVIHTYSNINPSDYAKKWHYSRAI
ncbi:MAG: hypothetical protein IJ634_01485 [Bacteroidales bacterium]|nr:hypothetical protein [Bacteroidales bacterium]